MEKKTELDLKAWGEYVAALTRWYVDQVNNPVAADSGGNPTTPPPPPPGNPK